MKTREHELVREVRENMKAFDLPSDACVMVAVSGGMDSMVLLHVLRHLNYKTSAAHVNFKLRDAESDGDAAFVKGYCAAHDIPFHLKEMDTHVYSAATGLNIQSAARQIRYDWWQELKELGQLDVLATAHHLDDQIETFFIHVLRGTGMKGLTGIPDQRRFYIRPLNSISHSRIEDYAETFQIPYRTDSSNEEQDYQRNKIRHQLIPLLKELSPGFAARMQHTLFRIGEEWKVWEKWQEDWIHRHVITENQGHHITLQPGDECFFLRWLEDQGIPWNLARDFIQADSPLTGQQLLHDHLVFERTRSGYFLGPKAPEVHITIEAEGDYAVGDRVVSIRLQFVQDASISAYPNHVYINPKAIRFPLILRTHFPGDTFQPMGMKGHSKKIQDLLVDRKLEAHEKRNVLVLENAAHILWVVGIQPDERTRVSENVTEVYEVKIRTRNV